MKGHGFLEIPAAAQHNVATRLNVVTRPKLALRSKVARVSYRVATLALGFALMAGPVGAQSTPPSHREVVGDLAYSCVERAFPEARMTRMSGSGSFNLVEPVLIERLVSAGKSVTVAADSSQYTATLVYRVESVRVELSRKSKNELNRSVFLDMTFQVVDAVESGVVDARVCSDSFSDTIPRKLANTLGHNDFTELNPTIPSGSVFSRWVQPVVLVAATAVGTYLLFNLRSRRADGG